MVPPGRVVDVASHRPEVPLREDAPSRETSGRRLPARGLFEQLDQAQSRSDLEGLSVFDDDAGDVSRVSRHGSLLRIGTVTSGRAARNRGLTVLAA
jgi:hypothetical protein